MASELFGKANDEFINENYERALELYSEALMKDKKRDDIYCNRAQAFIKLERYKEAVEDATEALDINSKNTKAYLRKGIGLFHLEDYQAAKETLCDGQKHDAQDNNFKTWIRKCEAEIDLAKQTTDNEPKAPEEVKVGTSTVSESNSATQSAQSVAPVMPPKEKSRYDWYQTQTHVVVTILLKNVKEDQMSMDIQNQSLSARVKLPTGSDYILELDLSHPIDPEKSIVKVLKSKIEVKLKKCEGIQWKKLEGEEPSNIKQIQLNTNDAVASYPSSSHYTRNWDKLAQEVAEEEKGEKKEGDAALNDLFQNIYAGGSEETKKAMMKSFYESGGTVLSTNWKEIGDKKTEVKPPDGMEFKKWDS